MYWLKNYNSALHRCARNDCLQGCKILLSYNIDTNITSIQGFKAIDMATDNIKKILQGNLHQYVII